MKVKHSTSMAYGISRGDGAGGVVTGSANHPKGFATSSGVTESSFRLDWSDLKSVSQYRVTAIAVISAANAKTSLSLIIGNLF